MSITYRKAPLVRKKWDEVIEDSPTVLDAFMKRHGIRSRELSECSGVSEQYICNLRRNRMGRNVPLRGSDWVWGRLVPVLQMYTRAELTTEDFR